MVLGVKNLPTNARDINDVDSVSGSGRSPGGGYGSPLQFFCLDNPHGQRSQACCSPWVHKELDITENHQLDGHEFEQAPGVDDAQGSLTCHSPWGHKESDTTE